MYAHVTSENLEKTLADTTQGILLCHKKLCPHCKNMEKVMEKFNAQRQGLSLFLLDSEEEPAAMAALGAERVPTIVIIKQGKAVAQKTGLMNLRELAALFDKSN